VHCSTDLVSPMMQQVKRTAEETLEPASKKPRFEQMQVQKVKEQLAARLDAPKEASVTVDNIK
jgi:parafibromin